MFCRTKIDISGKEKEDCTSKDNNRDKTNNNNNINTSSLTGNGGIDNGRFELNGIKFPKSNSVHSIPYDVDLQKSEKNNNNASDISNQQNDEFYIPQATGDTRKSDNVNLHYMNTLYQQ